MAFLMDIEVDDYLKQCVDLVPEAISEEYSRLSPDYAYWNEKMKGVVSRLLHAEFDEKQTEARLYLKYKEPGDGKKSPTEKAVDSAVLLDPIFQESHLKTLELTAERDYLKGVLKNLSLKAEMLVSMGATLRQEIQGDLRMREKHELRRSAEGFNEPD
jgi:hypothetical protein